MPVWNGERHLRSALDSLLAQTFEDFELIISDDGSTDSTVEIAQSYASRDRRIKVVLQSRLGMLSNFRAVFREAKGKYFMWAADHDYWEPDFLEAHVAVLEDNPEIVLAYPLVVGISEDGKELFRDRRRFSTFGLSGIARARAIATEMVGGGNMVYGLFRSDNLRKTSVYPEILMPDRLLLMELSVQGSYYQIDRYLWRRRYQGQGSRPEDLLPSYEEMIFRQRTRLFPNRRPPWITRLPTLALALNLVVRLSLRPLTRTYANAHLGPYMALLYMYTRRSTLKAEFRLFARRILKPSKAMF